MEYKIKLSSYRKKKIENFLSKSYRILTFYYYFFYNSIITTRKEKFEP